MTTENRRAKIIDQLNERSEPISASQLGKLFSVSRQVVVGDISILRAAGYQILALSKGYLLLKDENIVEIQVRHNEVQTRFELETLVNHNIKVLDISIIHPTYGKISASLNLTSQNDVDIFLAAKPQLLSTITNGVHTHRLLFSDANDLKTALSILKEAKILIT